MATTNNSCLLYFTIGGIYRQSCSTKTYTKPMNFTCSWKDCIELIRFLKHPAEVQHQFKIGKERRRHLHQQLNSSGVDATDTTECVWNPYTRVVTKTNASYERYFKMQQQERALLASLRLQSHQLKRKLLPRLCRSSCIIK